VTDKTSENFTLDCNGNKIFVGDKVMRMMNPSEFALDTYEVSEVVAGNIMLKNNYNIWFSNYFELQTFKLVKDFEWVWVWVPIMKYLHPLD